MAGLEKSLAWGLSLFLVAATWRWAGLRYADGPFFAGSALVLVILAFAGMSLYEWARDPFFWGGLAFLLYLGCQTWNAGRPLIFDAESARWFHAPPPYPLWPSAITRREAVQMLYWFGPAWAAALCIRSPVLTRRALGFILRVLTGNAAVLALVGTIQRLAGAEKALWMRPMKADFFASFTYTNHAAAFFLLMAGVAAGLLFRQLFRPDRTAGSAEIAGLATALVLCLAGANFSLSRTGIILSWGLTLFIVVYGLAYGWHRWRPAARLQLAAVTAGIAVLLALAIAGAGGDAIQRRFTFQRKPIHQAVPGMEQVNLDLSNRPRLWQIARHVFQETPWYGTGGWGFRHRAAFQLPRERWGELIGSHAGAANVHCDPLQFLVEFGLLGGGLMTFAWGVLVAGLFRADLRRGALFTLTCAGLALVVAFSLIDLPFRCPSVLWTWTAVLAALPKCTAPMKMAERGGFEPPVAL